MSEVMQTVALRDGLNGAAALIETELDALLPVPEGEEHRLVEAMRYAVMGGGKRMRGFLAIETARMFSVNITCAARVAASVEMLHAYSLIHDDLPAMDDDDLRRGKPSCHKAFDEATAILAGDALQTRAFEVLAEPDTHSDAEVRCELVLALGAASGSRGMVGGQMIDIVSEGKDLAPPLITRLQALGRDLGAAFQIADDILDAEGSDATLGKTAGKDAAQGKATMVSVMGIERARMQAEHLAKQAATYLDSFGEKAALLRALAAYTVTRRN
ncbi:MAG: farnesyl-diphosphate synthase [Acidiphilium sp. 37-64-53]|uniref:polyprenyl synthetase family protein n=1 Tax=Acidiphilium sp. 37-64-53 TaxID=1970299 RepID=UPI000BDAEFF0|nr:polyprenyl synthetase family protein [Acidiphilium sp. 37-64-53]OYW02062.1 MAG: farnesyl-diphosphate synthase [Acidiphilium sp. 37-64-53]